MTTSEGTMQAFWRTNLGKLIIGGCGTQVGLVVSVGVLGVTVALCLVCVSLNLLSLSLSQHVPGQTAATEPPLELELASTETDQLSLLQSRLDLLGGRMRTLQDTIPTPPAPPTPPPTPQAILFADKNAVNLRSGPGTHYNYIGRLARGDSLSIVGRNNDSSWWLVSTPDGQVAWASNMVVTTFNLNDAIPVVSIPALLVQPEGVTVAAGPGSIPDPVLDPAKPQPTPTPVRIVPQPAGTPTAQASLSRRFVQDTRGYKQLIRRLLLPTVSESFSPQGDQIAISEQIKLYTIAPDGAKSRVLIEDDADMDLVGGAVWSPDGLWLAVVVDELPRCECRSIGLIRLGDGRLTILEPPPDANLDLPRWTQDGRLLVTAYLETLIEGRAFIYDTAGAGDPAEGVYLLSSSHDGQKWFPWLPGRVWQVDPAEPPDSYYPD
jgi:hypothetical protein